MISNGVHMPLTKNAMIYWNEHSANEDFVGEWTDLINDDYDPTYFFGKNLQVPKYVNHEMMIFLNFVMLHFLPS